MLLTIMAAGSFSFYPAIGMLMERRTLRPLVPPDAILFFAGDGCGNFQLAGEMALTAPNTIAAADLNSDGRTDLVIGSTWTDPLGSNELHILLSEGDFRFREVGRLSSQARPWIGVIVADVNRRQVRSARLS